MNTAEVPNDQAPTEDEIAAAVLAIYTLRRRAVLPANQVSGWRRAARTEAIGNMPGYWERSSWTR